MDANDDGAAAAENNDAAAAADPPAGKKPRRRVPLGQIVADLETKLQLCQRQLEDERHRNYLGRLREASLKALCTAGFAIRKLYNLGGLPGRTLKPIPTNSDLEWEEILEKLEEEVKTLQRLMRDGGDGGSSSGGGGGEGGASRRRGAGRRGGGGGGAGRRRGGGDAKRFPESAEEAASMSSEEQAALGGVGVPIDVFLQSLMDQTRVDITKQEFIDFWKSSVYRTTMLLHQHPHDFDDEEGPEVWFELSQINCKMSTRVISTCMFHLWFFELLPYNMETSTVQEATVKRWDRVANGLALTPAQDLVFEVTTNWWDGKWEVLSRQREELAAEAQTAAEVPELQDAICAEMDEVLCQIRLDLIPLIVLMQAVLTPPQLAEYYIQSYPFIPPLTLVLDALKAKRAARKEQQGQQQPAHRGA